MNHLSIVPSLQARAVTIREPRFEKDTVARIVLAPQEVTNSPSQLLVRYPEIVDQWLVDWHGNHTVREVHDVSCYFATDVAVSGRGLIRIQGDLIASPEFMPKYLIDSLQLTAGGTPEAQRAYAPPTQIVEEPCIVFTGHGSNVFGHFLLEALLKLAVAQRALHPTQVQATPHELRAKVLVDDKAASWAYRILYDYFKIKQDDVITYKRDCDVVLLKKAILPTIPSINEGFHPFVNQLIQQIEPVSVRHSPVGIDRLFITRSLLGQTSSIYRSCINELTLCRIAAVEFGFTPIAPETMPFDAQIRLFANAKAVVGLYGSGLHTAIFSPPGTHVGSVGYLNLVQSTIGALRGHHNAYIRQRLDGPDGGFEVDEGAFRVLLKSLVGK
jgi:capsular polysaccharide biosynthesis protein